MLLESMELGSRGLLMAADIFEQFKKVFCERHSLGSVGVSSTLEYQRIDTFPFRVMGTTHERISHPEGVLRSFCGKKSDVQPFTVLLMKALCDLGRIEDLRFLFAVYVKELCGNEEAEKVYCTSTPLSVHKLPSGGNYSAGVEKASVPSSALGLNSSCSAPTVEFFNVYLYAISLTDTFNAYEVENVERLMKAHGVLPDIVTKLSFFILFLRLGELRTEQKEEQNTLLCGKEVSRKGFSPLSIKDFLSTISTSNMSALERIWDVLQDEVEEKVIKEGGHEEYPMLFSRLVHCFQVLFRLYHDAPVTRECYKLVRRICPDRLSSEQLIPYMVLTISNRGTPPHAAVEVLQHLEEIRLPSLSVPSNTSPAGGRTGKESLKRSSSPSFDSFTSVATNTSTDACLLPPSSLPSIALRPPPPPPLHSEMTILRLLTKCARHGDVDSLEYVLSYLQRHNLYTGPSLHRLGSSSTVDFPSSTSLRSSHTNLSASAASIPVYSGINSWGIQKENFPAVILLQVQTYARANKPLDGLAVAESASTLFPSSSQCWLPGKDVNIHLAKKKSVGERRLVRLPLSTDPITDFLSSLTRDGVTGLRRYIDSLDLFSPFPLPSTHAAVELPKDGMKGKGSEMGMNFGQVGKALGCLPSHCQCSSLEGNTAVRSLSTGMTVQFLIAAAAQLGDVELTSSLLDVYTRGNLGTPSALAFSSYVTAPLPHYISIGVSRVLEVLKWIHVWPPTRLEEGNFSLSSGTSGSSSSRNSLVEPILLSACMEVALTAGEVPLALHLCDAAGSDAPTVLGKYGPVLLRLAASTGDPLLIRLCQQMPMCGWR